MTKRENQLVWLFSITWCQINYMFRMPKKKVESGCIVTKMWWIKFFFFFKKITFNQYTLSVVDRCWNNTDAWLENSLKLFLDCQDKTHLSVNNAWISANGRMCCAVSYSNTFNGLVKLAPSLWADTGHSGPPKGRWRRSSAIQLDYDWLADDTKAPCKYSSYL